MTGLIKQDARWNKASLRQIANSWQVPLWGLKRTQPAFPRSAAALHQIRPRLQVSQAPNSK